MSEYLNEITTYVVAVTGGIGSGKSTVCELFAQNFSIPVIDADLVAREAVEPGQPALAKLVLEFGDAILDSSGHLDRRKLKAIVFADESKRKVLEGILHPNIRQLMRAKLLAIRQPYCLLGIPLLAEGGRHELVNRILVVDCPESVQLERVTKRDNLTEGEVTAIMRVQASRSARLAIADDVIVNAGDAAVLSERVAELHRLYSALAEKHKTVTRDE